MSHNLEAKIGVVGAGAFGTALATAFARNGKNVRVWARSDEIVKEINLKQILAE